MKAIEAIDFAENLIKSKTSLLIKNHDVTS